MEEGEGRWRGERERQEGEVRERGEGKGRMRYRMVLYKNRWGQDLQYVPRVVKLCNNLH